MAIYMPCLGEERDGRCHCGRPATTEVQVGWHNGEYGGPSGGQYDEICEECFASDYDSTEAFRGE